MSLPWRPPPRRHRSGSTARRAALAGSAGPWSLGAACTHPSCSTRELPATSSSADFRRGPQMEKTCVCVLRRGSGVLCKGTELPTCARQMHRSTILTPCGSRMWDTQPTCRLHGTRTRPPVIGKLRQQEPLTKASSREQKAHGARQKWEWRRHYYYFFFF